MSRSKSSKRWLNEHEHDHYVKLARQKGYRSRAVFKLLEIQEKEKLIKPGMVVVDLGAAPGGWSQVAGGIIKENGKVIALDILAMDAIDDVEFIEGDFTEDAVLEQLMQRLSGCKVDLVLSDMAPNLSGVRSADQAKSIYLLELALDFAKQTLKPGGSLLVKIFQGEGFDNYFKEMRQLFNKMKTFKPDASRDRSREVYLLARDFKE